MSSLISKQLKKLKLYLQPNKVLKRSVESFKDCTELYELDINYPELREDFFTNIDSFVPKLQSLWIQSGNKFSDTFIDSFHSMKFIQKVTHNVNETKQTKCWYFGKTLFEVKASPDGKYVIEVGNNCGLVCT